MGNTAILNFSKRQSRSKGANNTLINDGYLLANIVERGKDSISIALKKDDFRISLNENGRNSIYTLEDDDKNSYTVMIKDVQLKPIVNDFYHIDFQVVSLTEEVTVDVIINIVGQASVEVKGFIINRSFDSIPVTGFPQDIPDTIDIDVTGLEANDTITMGEVNLDKVKSGLDDDELIISISEPRMEVDDDEASADDVDVPVITSEDGEDEE
ncbi:MAG TPA: 50S ribosomal protein L25 [Clostridiales bacterium]|nr:50S ribosomal protein L25 [Clostridiales bacterium]